MIRISIRCRNLPEQNHNVQNRGSHVRVTIRSVLLLLNYLDYLVVPASHSNRAGFEALL
jgi:hypothetical protein